jgi:hypothetical protein
VKRAGRAEEDDLNRGIFLFEQSVRILPLLLEGGRTQEMAYGVVHELKGRLKAGCVRCSARMAKNIIITL